MSNVPHQEYFACDPCECGGHPDCPVCGVEATVRSREAELKKREEFDRDPATDEEIERSFDAYR